MLFPVGTLACLVHQLKCTTRFCFRVGHTCDIHVTSCAKIVVRLPLVMVAWSENWCCSTGVALNVVNLKRATTVCPFYLQKSMLLMFRLSVEALSTEVMITTPLALVTKAFDGSFSAAITVHPAVDIGVSNTLTDRHVTNGLAALLASLHCSAQRSLTGWLVYAQPQQGRGRYCTISC